MTTSHGPPTTLGRVVGVPIQSTERRGRSSRVRVTVRVSDGWYGGLTTAATNGRKAFARTAEAQAQINEVTAALSTGSYADPKRGAVIFRKVAEDWFAAKGSLKEKTRAGYRSLLDVIVLPQMGRRTPLRRIPRGHSGVG